MKTLVAIIIAGLVMITTPAYADQYDEWLNTPDYKGYASTKSGNFSVVCQGRDNNRTCRFYSDREMSLFRVNLYINNEWVGRVDDTPYTSDRYSARGSFSTKVINGVYVTCRVQNTERYCQINIGSHVKRLIVIGYVDRVWDSQFAYTIY